MNAAHDPTLRQRRLVVVLAVAVMAGIAAGYLIVPSRATAPDYVYAVAHPACFGAICLIAVRRSAQSARWMSLLLVAMFILDIASRPHVAALSALGLGAGAITILASLRSHQRLAAASTAACCALLAATLVGGLLLR